MVLTCTKVQALNVLKAIVDSVGETSCVYKSVNTTDVDMFAVSPLPPRRPFENMVVVAPTAVSEELTVAELKALEPNAIAVTTITP